MNSQGSRIQIERDGEKDFKEGSTTAQHSPSQARSRSHPTNDDDEARDASDLPDAQDHPNVLKSLIPKAEPDIESSARRML